jgi:TrmH family RNA methyltransferase
VASALGSGRHHVSELFVTPTAAERDRDLLRIAAADGTRVTLVTDRVVDSLSDTVTPQGVVAVVQAETTTVDAVLATSPRLLAVLVGISDPGNAGTVIRTADAAGADAVVLTGDAVDPHNPKCVRASAGSLFHLPVVRTADSSALVQSLRGAAIDVLATTLDDASDLESADVQRRLAGRVAWMFGSEAHGLPADLVGAADLRVRIAIHGRAESLNLAAAAAICLYATARVQQA